MGSASVVIFRALSLTVVALAGIAAVIYINRHEGGAGSAVFPRAITTPKTDCEDHLIHNLQCSSFPGVCSDPLGREVCQHTCNICGTTSASPTASGHCVDNVSNGFHCGYIPNICNNSFGQLLCRRHCSVCVPGAGDITPPPGILNPDACEDYVAGGYNCSGLPNVCNDDIGQVLCKRYCGICKPGSTAPSSATVQTTPATATTNTAAASTTEPPCVDHMKHGRTCSVIPGICFNMYGHMVCRRHCRACNSTAPPANTGQYPHHGTCVDYVGNGMRCHDLPSVCQDPEQIGPQILCPKTCGHCHTAQQTSPTTPAQTQSPSSGSCHDHLIYDVLCSHVQNPCRNPFLKIFCPRHCNTCTGQGPNTVLQQPPPGEHCYDMVGAGFTCANIPGVCFDSLASAFCPRYCGACASSTSATTSAKTTHSHQHHTSATTATTKPPTASTATPKTTHSHAGGTSTSGTTSGSSGVCEDNLGNGLSCSSFANACSSAFAISMCPKTCNKCGQTTSASYVTHTTHSHNSHGSATTSSHDTCRDNVPSTGTINCQSLKDKGFCNDQYSYAFCNKTCGHCSDTSTSSSPPVTSSAVCQDMATSCSTLNQTFPGLCADLNGKQTCQKFCGLCHDNPTPTGGATSPTQQSTASGGGSTASSSTCKPRFNVTTCFDKAEESICRVSDFCHKPIAKALCRRTCRLCDDGCRDRLRSPAKCTDLVGADRPVATISDLCTHPLGLKECEATCGCPGYCPLSPGASPTP